MSAPGVTGLPQDAAAGRDTALVSLRNLSVSYRPDGRSPDPAGPAALSGVTLDIHLGERLAIIGESGSGKSTLALAVAGLLPATAEMGGRVEWTDLLSDSAIDLPPPLTPPFKAEADLVLGNSPSFLRGGGISSDTANPASSPLPGRDYGFVFQDPAASLDPVMPVGRQIAEVVRAHLGTTWPQAEAHARDLIARVHLPDPERLRQAYPHQLSGGQKQRVALACAIAAGPRLLIADEATSALDTIVQAEIVALIRELVTTQRMALLFISHDIALAAQLADRIAVFRHGELVEIGTAADVIARPRTAYTRMLLAAHTSLDAVPMLSRDDGHA